MSFVDPQPSPARIGAIRIQFKETPYVDDLGVTRYNREARYDFEVYDANGNRIMGLRYDSGNLAPHLTPTQINGLIQLMTDLRAKAVAEVIPPSP